MLSWFRNRFGERSTWMALFGVATAFGFGNFTPEQISAISTFAVLLVVVPDKGGK